MKLAQLNIAAFAILNEKASLKQEFSEVTFKEKKMQEICISFRADSSGMAALVLHWSLFLSQPLYILEARVGTLRPFLFLV